MRCLPLALLLACSSGTLDIACPVCKPPKDSGAPGDTGSTGDDTDKPTDDTSGSGDSTHTGDTSETGGSDDTSDTSDTSSAANDCEESVDPTPCWCFYYLGYDVGYADGLACGGLIVANAYDYAAELTDVRYYQECWVSGAYTGFYNGATEAGCSGSGEE